MTSRSLRVALAATKTLAAVSLAAALVPACAAHSNYEAKRLPDGTLHLKCEGALTACIARAETACHGTNYEVIKARDQRDLLGHENGAVQVEVRTSEAIIRCVTRGQPAPPLPPDADAQAQPQPQPNAAPAVAAAVPPPPPPRSCVPGATQACIGPGRCDGGQSCLPDGSAFGPCDCGTLGPPPSATAATAAPPGPPPTSVAPAPAAPGARPIPPSAAPAGPAKPLQK